IGRTVREQLFGDEDPIGATIRVEGQLFEVIGVLAPKGQSSTGQDQDDTILMPYTTALQRLPGHANRSVDDVLCSATSADDVAPAIEQITALMRERHHIAAGTEDDFNIRRPDESIKAEIEAGQTLSHMLTGAASISLLVGGIGI